MDFWTLDFFVKVYSLNPAAEAAVIEEKRFPFPSQVKARIGKAINTTRVTLFCQLFFLTSFNYIKLFVYFYVSRIELHYRSIC